MPLFENIDDLKKELRRQKILEWEGDAFSDLTVPCEQVSHKRLTGTISKENDMPKKKKKKDILFIVCGPRSDKGGPALRPKFQNEDMHNM